MGRPRVSAERRKAVDKENQLRFQRRWHKSTKDRHTGCLDWEASLWEHRETIGVDHTDLCLRTRGDDVVRILRERGTL